MRKASTPNAAVKTKITALNVQEWFKEFASKSSPLPGLEICAVTAKNLMRINALHENWTDPRPDLGKAREHALNFLKHLPAARLSVENTKSAWESGVGFTPPECDLILADIQAAEAATRQLIALREWPKHKKSWHILAHHARAQMIQAWLSAGVKTAKIPKAVNPDDVMCKIVTKALLGMDVKAMGKEVTPEAVSEALRGRRGNPIKKKGKQTK